VGNKVWDLVNGICLRVLCGDTRAIQYAALAAGGKRMVSASNHDQSVRVWNVESGVCLHTMAVPGFVRGLGVSEAGSHAVLVEISGYQESVRQCC